MLAKGREKHDRKAPKRYGFENMVSFALVVDSGDPSSIQNGMQKRWSHHKKGKTWELIELPKINKARRCKWVQRKTELADKALSPTRLVERHGFFFFDK